MSKITKLLGLTIVLLLVLTGCKEIEVDKQADGNTVVAEYKGGTILKSEALTEYEDIEAMYIAYGYEDALKDAETVATLKHDVLDYMVTERILAEKAAEFNLGEIPEDKRAELIKAATEEYNMMLEIYGPSFATEEMTEEEARTAAIEGLANSYGVTENAMINMDLAEYKDQMFSDHVTKDVTVTDEDLRVIYDERIAEDKATYTEDPGAYDSAVTYGDGPLWAPEGVRYVKHILIKPDDAIANEMTDIEDEIAAVELAIDDKTETAEGDAESELDDTAGEGDAPVEAAVGGATLDNTGDEPVVTEPEPTEAPTATDEPIATEAPAATEEPAEPASVDLDADSDADTGAEDAISEDDFIAAEEEVDYSTFTIEELNAKLAELNTKLEEVKARARTSIEPTVNEVLAKIEAGEDFDALIAEYGQDPGMQSEPTMSTGYPVSALSTIWDTDFTAGSMSIAELGGVSEPVYTSFGCHIIKYVSDVVPGAVEFESVKESMRDEALENKKAEFYEAEVQRWVGEAEVKLYPEKL